MDRDAQEPPETAPETPPAMTPPSTFNEPRHSGWPMTIGVISIVFGSLGLLCYGCNSASTIASPWLVTMVPEDQRPPTAGGMLLGVQIFQLCTAFVLSLWLLFAGIGLTRRRPWARAHLVGWSVAKMLVTFASTSVSILFANQFVQMFNDQWSQGGQAPLFKLTDGMFIILAIVGLAWYLVWPVFLLIWFSRESVRQEVAAWEAESRAMI